MTTRTVTARQANSIMKTLVGRLEASDELENVMARAILVQAQRNAAHRPTPQAEMAAENLTVEQGTILPFDAHSEDAAVAIGSEFGSGKYLQFQAPHNTQGYWLMPAVQNPDDVTLEAGEDWLDEQVEDAITRG